MKKDLIIVESPAKIKTLQKILGHKYSYGASYGHIRDLPQKKFGIDLDDHYTPEYVVPADKKEVVAEIKKNVAKSGTVYLAPDPDREGEAIAWHISELLPKKTKIKRVTFNAFTKSDVQEALHKVRSIDLALVDAQQTRRLLDRMVGYSISPILMRRVKGAKDGGLSAGRVQSVALKLVVDRERDIAAFIPTEYWTVFGKFSSGKKGRAFEATLQEVDGRKLGRVVDATSERIATEAEARALVERANSGSYIVAHRDQGTRKRNPSPPFTTSTLQQEAYRHYNFAPARTMSLAQSLYEGIELEEGDVTGLITYMRTDSVRVAGEALGQARTYIGETYGKEYLPPTPRHYTSKKSAQDAHEAIRPTDPFRTPERVARYLSPEQNKLYALIWRRFVASQMEAALYDTLAYDIQNDRLFFRVSGSSVRFKGFLVIYEEREDEIKEEEIQLPLLEEGTALQLLEARTEQSFTRPPPRFPQRSPPVHLPSGK